MEGRGADNMTSGTFQFASNRISSSVLIGSLMLVASTAAANKDRYDVGENVPVFTLKTINPDDSAESYVSIDKYYGAEARKPKKAILMSFFATYCEPCKREMPYLAALHEQYKDKGLQILSISIDKEADKIEQARQLGKDKRVRFPMLMDRFNIVAKRYFISKLPCVYILDGNGKVADVHVGYSGDVTRSLLEGVRKLIGEPVTDPVPESLKSFMGHGAASKKVAVADKADSDKSKPKAKSNKKAKKRKRRRRKRK